MARPDLIPPRLEAFDDVQALVKSGFGSLTACSYLLVRVNDVATAKQWLAAAPVTSAADLATRQERVLQVALSASGLRALGLNGAVLARFSAEFLGGMAEPARARRLGDVGDSAPEGWDWGYGESEPHALVVLIAAEGALPAWLEQVADARFAAAFHVLRALETSDMGGREPFGFRDGISQPTIDFGGTRTPGGEPDLDYGNLIAPGEFVLGYRNEYGLLTERPLVEAGDADLPRALDAPGFADLGRNGAYLVFRQLEQDVAGFWRFVDAAYPDDPIALAEAFVGRSKDGVPRAPASTDPIRGVADDDAPLNGFTFRADPNGRQCPIGAHIRRANPRTGDLPSGRVGPLGQLVALLGFAGDGDADRIASSRFHRLLRRGREYGRLAPDGGVDATEPAGLHFLCLMANISRQFEFVQNAWFQSSTFSALHGESDPLLGSRAPLADGASTDGFSQPRADGPADRAVGLPRFVTVKGGAYFFLPGLQALRYLAR